MYRYIECVSLYVFNCTVSCACAANGSPRSMCCSPPCQAKLTWNPAVPRGFFYLNVLFKDRPYKAPWFLRAQEQTLRSYIFTTENAFFIVLLLNFYKTNQPALLVFSYLQHFFFRDCVARPGLWVWAVKTCWGLDAASVCVCVWGGKLAACVCVF